MNIAHTEGPHMIHGYELTFDEGKHAYTWGGILVPGVTTILGALNKPALVPWAAGMAADHFLAAVKAGRTDLEVVHKESKGAHAKRVKDAASSGTNVHEYAEAVFKNLPLPELKTDQAKRGVEAFHKWLDSHKIEILASERRLFSKEFHYAGTCDFVANIDGVIGVGDIKTSSGIYPEMRFQTAAYQHALQEELGIQFPVRWIVRFDKKTGEFEAKSFHNFPLDFAGFKAALNIHRTLQEIKKETA
jgi:hypothetical protein